MYRILLLLYVCFLATSCSDNRIVWLKEYQVTKCFYEKTQANFKQDSISSLAKQIAKLAEIQTEIQKIELPIHSEIAALNHKIGQINIQYLEKSQAISEEQERISGHNPNAVFENKIDENDKNNNREVRIFENKIKELQSKLDDNKTLQELLAKQNQIQEQIQLKSSLLKEKYRITFDSLENKLDNHNSDFRMILEDLKDTEKEKFKNLRKKATLNPCH